MKALKNIIFLLMIICLVCGGYGFYLNNDTNDINESNKPTSVNVAEKEVEPDYYKHEYGGCKKGYYFDKLQEVCLKIKNKKVLFTYNNVEILYDSEILEDGEEDITYYYHELGSDYVDTGFVKMINSDNLYSVGEGYYLVDLKNKRIANDYYDYSCSFYSDVQTDICEGTNVTIATEKTVDKDNDEVEHDFSYGIFDIDKFEIVTKKDYEAINYVGDGLFIATLNGKNILLSTKGEELMSDKAYIGAVGVDKVNLLVSDDGKTIDLYDNELNQDNRSIKEFYDEEIIKYNIELNTYEECEENDDECVDGSGREPRTTNCLVVDTCYRDWGENDSLCYGNVYKNGIKNEGITTKDKSFNREMLTISNLCVKEYIYEINDSAFTKLSNKKFNFDAEEDGWCF